MLKRKAFSMIEVMCAICIFALAILPLVWLGSNQTKGAYSASKHMMASQLASSYMDNILKRPYEDLINNTKIEGKVLDSPPTDKYEELFDLSSMISGLSDTSEESGRSAEDNIRASAKNFRYSIEINKFESNNEKVAKTVVSVSYLVVEGNNDSRQYVTLTSLKFGERNG